MRVSLRRALASLVIAALGALQTSACKDRPAPPDQPVPKPSALPASEPVPQCAEVSPGSTYLVGEPGAGAAGSDDDAVAPPFAVELGGAVGTPRGYAVSGLRERGEGTGAFIVLIGADGRGGRTVDLGPVHGDVDSPELVSAAGELFTLVPEGDAGGRTLRLGRVRDSGKQADVTWGAQLPQRRGESQAAGLAVTESRGLVVWDEWVDAAGRGVVRAASFPLQDISQAESPRVLSPEKSDVEAPQLVGGAHGYWIAWISHTAYELPDAGVVPADRGKGRRMESEPVGSAEPSRPVVDLGQRWLEVGRLDASGKLLNPPIVVTPRESHVLVFQLSLAPNGTAWLAWRDDHTSPGVERGRVTLARIGPDGSIERTVIEDQRVGAGTPTLLVDAEPPRGGVPAWLALGAVDGETELAVLDRNAKVGAPPQPAAGIGRAEPLALHAGRILLARPRGKAAELSVVECRMKRVALSASPARPAPPPEATEADATQEEPE